MASNLVSFILAGVVFWVIPFGAGLLLGYKLWYKKESKTAIFDLPPKKVEFLELPPPQAKQKTSRKRKKAVKSTRVRKGEQK